MKEWRWIFQSVVYEGVNYSLPRKAWICNKLGLIFNILYTRKRYSVLAEGTRRTETKFKFKEKDGARNSQQNVIAHRCVFGAHSTLSSSVQSS
jgi:hypothetical protein